VAGWAEAPTKLVTLGLSPFLISLCMVSGVFVARWTLPVVLKGTTYVFLDLRERAHLMVGPSSPAPCGRRQYPDGICDSRRGFVHRLSTLEHQFVGRYFLGLVPVPGLRGRAWKTTAKVLGGAGAVVFGATLLGLASVHRAGGAPHRLVPGILAALGAGLLWGTMYIPYRKAYLSGMNPLSFVTVFTVGELATTSGSRRDVSGRPQAGPGDCGGSTSRALLAVSRGFCWVLGDLFQQYAAKYIGIGRGIRFPTQPALGPGVGRPGVW